MSFTEGRQMKPEGRSNKLLGVARARAKMHEYGVPERYFNDIVRDPADLFTLSIGILGDLAAAINRGDKEPEELKELSVPLLFSARFFDSYLQSKLDEPLNPYLVLLGSSSYYLCDLPGSASVMARYIEGECPDLEAGGIEFLLHWLLIGDRSEFVAWPLLQYGSYLDDVSRFSLKFFKRGKFVKSLLRSVMSLRRVVYEVGTPRQLLLADILAAVVQVKIQHSSWVSLPKFSSLTETDWTPIVRKESFVKELWPAQMLIGEAGILKGTSTVIQMPTSAGKTKAAELIIRSAFLSNRTSLTVIIAPFRALCHEIKNTLLTAFKGESIGVDELSDVFQEDFEVKRFFGHKQVLVVTPEKLLYLLRHNPEVASEVGLLIFDEGHQFDSGKRGIVYELLITSLLRIIPIDAQKVLISAVISNAAAVSEWLNGASNVVEGTHTTPTFRSVGFVNWSRRLGQIQYMNSRRVDEEDVFVPRVLSQSPLKKKPRETAERVFPDKEDGQSIAVYLGMKLLHNGSVAVFCGQKGTVSKICAMIVDVIEREASIDLPVNHSDRDEVQRLFFLHKMNLGADSVATVSARHGIYAHHGNMPNGIRLAIEHAMRDGLVCFVVCTSTLAQGVNLPIRYLIVTGVYQGRERIKVRDFHNLIGRVGRAGMHTEGSVLFADPDVYNQRARNGPKWRKVRELLIPSNSEPCISKLLEVFTPIVNDRFGNRSLQIVMDPLDFVKAYIEDPDDIERLPEDIMENHPDSGFSHDRVRFQVEEKIGLITAIESYLLAHWDESESELVEQDLIDLAEETLAYHLADEVQEGYIRELFKLLGQKIIETVPTPDERRAYGKTLYGIRDASLINGWVVENIEELLEAETSHELMELLWPIMSSLIGNKIFSKFNKPEARLELSLLWLEGASYSELFEGLKERGVKRIWGSQLRDFKIEDVVDFFSSGISYDATLVVGAVCEFVKISQRPKVGELITKIDLLQKQMKYGLPSAETISVYEFGFSDRVIAQDLVDSLAITSCKREVIVQALRQQGKASIVMDKYPTYFQQVLQRIIS